MKSRLLSVCCTLLLGLFAVSSLTATAAHADEFETRLNRAIELSDNFQDEEALAAFKSALELQPDNYDALWNIVMLHTSIGHRQTRSSAEEAHYDEAFEYAKILREAHPEQAGSYFAYAAAVGRKAQSVGARERIRMSTEIRENAEKAVELDADYSRAWNVLGNWHHRAANLSRLERLAANALFGGAPEGASNESARAAFERAMELDPGFILYYHDKAEFLITIGKKDEARRVLQKGLELDIRTSDDERWKSNMREMLRKL
jgi:regulator of microtubule dynamics protein 3